MLWSGGDDSYPSHMKVTPNDGILKEKLKNVPFSVSDQPSDRPIFSSF